MVNVKTMSMTIDFETERRVRQLAYAKRISVSAMIRMLLRQALEVEEYSYLKTNLSSLYGMSVREEVKQNGSEV